MLEERAPVCGRGLVSAVHDGVPSPAQVALLGAQAERPHTAALFGVLPSPMVPFSTIRPGLFYGTRLTDHILGLGYPLRLQDGWSLV